jgi:hypothetical protein
MIVLNSGDKVVIIIEPGNIENLKKGLPMKLPQNMALVYSPDIEWLMDKICQNKEGISPEKLSELILEGLERKEVFERPYHPAFDITLSKRKKDS